MKITIEPSFHFGPIGIQLAAAIGNIEPGTIIPRITAYGVGESSPNWDFEPHAGHPLRGCKMLCLTVKKPRAAQAVRVTLDIGADVSMLGHMFTCGLSHRDRLKLKRLVCTD